MPSFVRRISNWLILGAVLVLAGSSGTAWAGPIFTGTGGNPETGNTVSGQAEFSISGDVLTIVLTNATAGGTLAQGDSLTGVLFDIDGSSPVLSLTSISLTAGSTIHTSKTTTDNAAPLSGSWTDQLDSGASAEYGVATTGFDGVFKGGTITRGNSSADYGLIAPGTSLASGFPKFPYIANSLTFTFSGASGLSEDDIANVVLLFGTDGTGSIETEIEHMPEPGSLTLAALGIAGALGASRRRTRKSRAC